MVKIAHAMLKSMRFTFKDIVQILINGLQKKNQRNREHIKFDLSQYNIRVIVKNANNQLS